MEFEKPLVVGMVEQYEVKGPNLSDWLAGGVVDQVTVSTNSNGVTILSHGFTDDSVTFLAQGVARGSHLIRIFYGSSGRTDTFFAVVRVIHEGDNPVNLIPSTLRAKI